MKECAVVIPCYKEALNNNEAIAVEQCSKILNEFDIYFIAPEGMNNKYFNRATGVEYFKSDWFKSRDSYSAFMLNNTLYSRFINYRYILIYQLDAFVFKNELEHFCSLGYDYIGAPWPNGVLVRSREESKLIKVGNGGFSLRKIDTFVQWTEMHKKRIDDLLNNYALGEDFIIGFIEGMNIAPYEVAETFSVEILTKEMVDNRDKLPFGAHNIASYEYELSRELYLHYGYEYEKPQSSFKVNTDVNYIWNVEKRLFEDRYFEMNIKAAVKHFFPDSEIFVIWGTGKVGGTLVSIFEKTGIDIAYLLETEPTCKFKFGYQVKEAEAFIKKNSMSTGLILAFKNTQESEKLLDVYGRKRIRNYVTYEDIVVWLNDYRLSSG